MRVWPSASRSGGVEDKCPLQDLGSVNPTRTFSIHPTTTLVRSSSFCSRSQGAGPGGQPASFLHARLSICQKTSRLSLSIKAREASIPGRADRLWVFPQPGFWRRTKAVLFRDVQS
jgi:hypothetical protein